MNEKPLDGRGALVTGCSRRIGIGFAIATRLAELGADLCVHSYAPYDAGQPWGADPDGVTTLLEDLRAHGGKVAHVEADFLDPVAPARVMEAAVHALHRTGPYGTVGHVDILVANHAYSTMGALEEVTVGEIDRHLHVNVRATLLLVREFAGQHDGRSGGRILFLTSGQHLGPMPGELAYIASKGALHPLTRSLSAYLADRSITVNTVNPGATDTGYASPELYEEVLALEPQGRWGRPDDAARWITGQVINSTGGGP